MPEYQPRDPKIVSRNMSAIRSKDTEPELFLRRCLHGRGYRYRVHHPGLPGRPDIAFMREQVAVFVDGDFWHGRVLVEEDVEALRTRIKKNHDYWLPKIQRTVERDKRYTQELRRMGWTVLRFWASEIRRAPEKIVNEVVDVVEAQRR